MLIFRTIPKSILKKTGIVLDLQNKNTETEHFEVGISYTTKRVFVQLPKNDTDTHFLSSFRYVHWDHNNRQWIIPNYGKNLELIKNYFRNRTVTISEQQDEKIVDAKQSIAEANILKVQNIQNRILRIYFVYN